MSDHTTRTPRATAEVPTPQQSEPVTTIFERSVRGRRAATVPPTDVDERPLDELIPARLLRERPAELPEVSEPELVRHYNRLSRRNFDLDTGPYPLGSCTMKHNPRVNERVAALPGHARLHPAQEPKRAQGALELMWRLERALSEICGLPHVSLQPSAGSHGELAGLLLTRAYHEDRGEERTRVLTPDTSHGTNPATVTMAGYEVVKVATDERGGVDLDDLRSKSDESVACLMLTNPNTLGVFDENIVEIARIVHGVGGTLYYDGANLNAIMGWSRPGDMGFDIVHVNLHKSFSQPHGGGGPGAGPIAVSDRIEPYLPVPRIVRGDGANGAERRFDLDYSGPKSIGRLRGFQGNFGVFARAYAYIRSLGGDGLRDASETAVLNANYLLARLRQGRGGKYLPLAFDRLCMHEFVLSGSPAKHELGVKTLDVAKRLLDYGFHPPTIYFPLLVEEALMVEPTETETKEGLDALADAFEQILAEAERDPEILRQAPFTTPVRRLDEAQASRKPVLRQPLD
ncbi:MAG TPA: aminomethyl-transferring glycine dehydrogenase subunit GcvPB [Solirubrobacterales bacterium]|jgi:glycine dehydrogenase subunit 2|nr:aminomethyl-transferring glycine dehydrogenase subunit GcvPB [Solirubrobacterales bacterium]